MTVKAFAPANISCLFTLFPGKTPATTGSLGVGFTLTEGVTVRVEKSEKGEVLFNNKEIDFPTVRSVIHMLCHPERSEGSRQLTEILLKVSIYSPFPLGCGFGISGASALATAYAINDLFRLGKTKKELALIAHIAEVENGTGLGDVVNQYYQGFFLKRVPSWRFIVQRIPISRIPVYIKYFSKISTKEVLLNKKRIVLINKAGEKAIQKIDNLTKAVISNSSMKNERSPKVEISPSLHSVRNDKSERSHFREIIQVSKQFAQESGLLTSKEVIDCITDIEARGGHASMIMLGNGVFSDIPFAGASKFTIAK